jgi:hypothetical protein
MKRLTLILSDLYLPEESDHRMPLPQAIDLPNFDWLLRFAQRTQRVLDWRLWLAGEMNQEPLARLPIAQACALGLLNPGQAGSAWLATPVHLEARLDHVRLPDRGLLRLGAWERAAWCAEFAHVFSPQYSLHDAGERGFLLAGVAPNVIQSQDPARLLDADIGPGLPRGPEAAEIRRLMAEIEMWLHRVSLNTRREQARERRISAMWLWGGGLEQKSANPVVAAEMPPDVHFYGGDPFVAAIARAVAEASRHGLRCATAPSSFRDLDLHASHAVVELTPMTGGEHGALHSLEAQWLAAVRAALSNGSLATCDLIANDRWFRILSRPNWKFWRRRGSWLQRLGSEPRSAKA